MYKKVDTLNGDVALPWEKHPRREVYLSVAATANQNAPFTETDPRMKTPWKSLNHQQHTCLHYLFRGGYFI